MLDLFYECPLGCLRICASDNGITSVSIQNEYPENISSATENPFFKQVIIWLDDYFGGNKPALVNLPLDPKGTVFQKKVWDYLAQIPYGCTTTYGEIAKVLASESKSGRMSAQAVGQAVGANPLAIILPCHRVLGHNGRLTGYEYGLDKKAWLLNHEGINYI